MYIDAFHDKEHDKILVVERDKNGKRQYKEFPVEHTFYYDSLNGKYQTIYGQLCDKFTTNSSKLFRKELSKAKLSNTKVYESDLKPVFRTLESFYKGASAPDLHITFFDIEVDFHETKGFSMPDDPFNKITAVSLYNNWEDKCYSLVLKPDTITEDKAKEICNQFPDTYLCESEEVLLTIFLDLIKDSDILSGWNSEGFDIPYVVKRIILKLGSDFVRQLCLWNNKPVGRMFERYGKEQITYNLTGRIHLDYLQLYRKYTYHEMHSYSLDTISEYELKERKVAYNGSLDDLYKLDFKKFVEYSRQDTMLLVKLENKLKFIGLTNTLAHENGVLLPTTIGVVGLSDQAIIIETHERGFIVPDRERESNDDADIDYSLYDTEADAKISGDIWDQINKTIAGAYVAHPKVGLHRWIGSVDITSLYPSVIMALNISPETIVGQLNQDDTRNMVFEKMKAGASFADAWADHFSSLEVLRVFDRKKNEDVIIELEKAKKPTKSITVTGAEAYKFIFLQEQPYSISANGTIFSHERRGIIPELLEKWFKERKEMQGKAKALAKTITENPDKLNDLSELKKEYEFWDQRQLIKKIQLNSLYGAITNPGSRFFDQRMGQSITLTGRNIAVHMASEINRILTGEKDHQGNCIIYGDTDSAYFSAWPIRDQLGDFEFTEDSVVKLYDGVADAVNATFKQFMIDRFHCENKRAGKIKANREICARTGIYKKKKRYATLVYDVEGNRPPGGKLKIMGMETQRSDTPTFIQDFLKEVLKKALSDEGEEIVVEHIKKFRQELKKMNAWEMGTPKRCNNLSKYTAIENKQRNSRLPGHIRAAYNWNKFKKAFGDNRSLNILDGGKTIVCKLKPNALQITSMAYPIDQAFLPDWFRELPFDVNAMEFTLMDKKLDNLIGVLDWDLTKTKQNDILDDLFE